MAEEQNLLGVGLYSPRDCALLTRVHVNKVNRWLFGYKDTSHGSIKERPPIWEPEVKIDNVKTLSFKDLMEVRAIGQFLKTDLSPQKIRKAYDILCNKWGEKYPFSSQRVKTDGEYIFHTDGLTEVFSNQQNMKEIIKQSLKNVEFDDDKPVKWWINGDRHIVLDPKRSFGKPIDSETGIPIAALYNRAVASGQDLEKTARYFDVSLDCVKRAFEFQSTLVNPNGYLH